MQSVHNLVRGLAYPYPGAFTYYEGERYRIWGGQAIRPARPYVGRIPGRVVSSVPGHGVEVLTADGIYLVRKASRDGQPPVPAETLFRSVRAHLGRGASPSITGV